jgi:hypothetical protein
MRRTLLFLATAAVMFCPIARAQDHVSAGISIGGGEGLNGFYLAIGDYYHVPQHDVSVIRERSIPDDELPVVFFLARKARMEPRAIVELRLSGMSWNDITARCGLGPDIYYYRPVRNLPGGSQYGRAFGHYSRHPRSQWRRERLSDEEIVNLVNLRFAAEHEHMSAAQVIQQREGGRSFTTIYSSRHGGNPQAGPGRGAGDGPRPGQRRGRTR